MEHTLKLKSLLLIENLIGQEKGRFVRMYSEYVRETFYLRMS